MASWVGDHGPRLVTLLVMNADEAELAGQEAGARWRHCVAIASPPSGPVPLSSQPTVEMWKAASGFMSFVVCRDEGGG